MNRYLNFPGEAYITWADGVVAAAELARFVQAKTISGRKRLYLTSAGNRPNDEIVETAQAYSGAFDEYVLGDWDNLRGREAGEVPRLLEAGLRHAPGGDIKIMTVASHPDAVDHLARSAENGDLTLFVIFEDDAVLKRLDELFRAGE
jgi:hypothetical protein